jgi:hypothetical protein
MNEPNQRIGRNPKRRSRSPRVSVIKRNLVKNTYYSLREIFEEFNVPCVEKVCGTGIVRISVRNRSQLENIASIMNELLELSLIAEVGIPMEYSNRYKSIMLFLQPVNIMATNKVHQVFQESLFQFNHVVLNIHPTKAA